MDIDKHLIHKETQRAHQGELMKFMPGYILLFLCIILFALLATLD